jgi:SAM-dependent methyltransferase
MSNRIYHLDPELLIWRTRAHESIAYSDGEDVENRILEALRQCQNISIGSDELPKYIKDWPSEYHLSSTRSNLLRPLGIGHSDRVLELGCGCGAITRYLGEAGATVIAVEGSSRRAQISASRCRDLQNVTIYCDNLINFVSNEKFDFVTLIGVLEYAPSFVGEDDPILAVLNHARSFLKKGGALILAIENQLGLKYFNGCSEDHVGIPFYGINDLYSNADPVTFGRIALAEKLSKAGLPSQEFFFPFPDYKLPGLILSEAALQDGRLNIADLLIHNTGRNYPESHHRAFAEDLAWKTVIRNQLLPDLANSFLVLARQGNSNQGKADWLAKMYSRGNRRPCYQVESSIVPHENGGLVVRKHKLFPDKTSDGEWLSNVVGDSSYLTGKLLVGKVHGVMAREAGLDELAACFTPWLKFLLAHAAIDKNGKQTLPGRFVDCIPANLIETNSGELLYFDAEWVNAKRTPLAWIVVRGIANSLIGCLENNTVKQITYRQFIVHIAERGGIPLHEEDFTTANHCEARLIAQCHINASSQPCLADFLDTPIFLTSRLANLSPGYRESLAWHQTELKRVKETVSWRITAPLRVVWNLYIRLAHWVRNANIRNPK